MTTYRINRMLAVLSHPGGWGKQNYFCIHQEGSAILFALLPAGRLEDRKENEKKAEEVCRLLSSEPIKMKFDNRTCDQIMPDKMPCELYEIELEFRNSGDISSALSEGWPICPECGEEMTEV